MAHFQGYGQMGREIRSNRVTWAPGSLHAEAFMTGDALGGDVRQGGERRLHIALRRRVAGRYRELAGGTVYT